MSKRPHNYGSSGPRKPTTIDLDAANVRVEEAVDAAKDAATEAVEAVKDTVDAGVAVAKDEAEAVINASVAPSDTATEMASTVQAASAPIEPATEAVRDATDSAPDQTPTPAAVEPTTEMAVSETDERAASSTAETRSDEPASQAAEPSAESQVPTEASARAPETAEPARPVVAPVMAPPPKKGGAGAILGGALGGGILGTAAAYLVATLGFWPGAGPAPADPAANAKIVALEQEVKALAAKPAPALPTAAIDQLAEGLKALQTKVAALPAPVDPGAALAQVTTKVTALEASVKAASERAEAAARDLEALRKAMVEAPAGASGEAAPAALTALNQAVADLSARLDATRQELGGTGAEAMSALKAELEAQAAKAGEAAATAKAAADAALAEARQRADALDAALKALAGQAGDQASAQIETLQKELGGLSERLEAALAGPVADVSKKVEGLTSDNANAVAARDQATLAVALGAVKTALDAGRPFATELQTAKALAGSNVDLSALEAVAATGVKPVTALVEAFPAVARRVLAVVDGAGADAGLMDNLMARAQNLVRIRPVGEVAGTDPASRLARVEAKLKAGDASAALGEWLELPEGARAAGGDFGAALAARAAADVAINTVTAALLATLAKPTQ